MELSTKPKFGELESRRGWRYEDVFFYPPIAQSVFSRGLYTKRACKYRLQVHPVVFWSVYFRVSLGDNIYSSDPVIRVLVIGNS